MQEADRCNCVIGDELLEDFRSIRETGCQDVHHRQGEVEHEVVVLIHRLPEDFFWDQGGRRPEIRPHQKGFILDSRI